MISDENVLDPDPEEMSNRERDVYMQQVTAALRAGDVTPRMFWRAHGKYDRYINRRQRGPVKWARSLWERAFADMQASGDSDVDDLFLHEVSRMLPDIHQARRFIAGVERTFRDVPLSGMSVLDIGGGRGLYSYHALLQGAGHVVCLEPATAGARPEYGNLSADDLTSPLMQGLVFLPETLQDYDPEGERFNVILLNNSINHVEEEACVNLLTDPAAREAYRRVFQKIYDLAKPNATIIVTDVSSKNLWARLGVRNPFAPTIEWTKHHQPEIWAGLLEQVGFAEPEIEWVTPLRLGPIGDKLLGHKWGAYLLSSAFRLRMRKPPVGAQA